MPVAVDVLLPALTVGGGLCAAVFTALRFNRDDATAIVNQQKIVLDGMRDLNAELQGALDRQRVENKEQAARLVELRAEVEAVRLEKRPADAG